MLTIEKLKEYGADVDSGLARCMGMQDFYLRLVNMELDDKNFQALKEAMEKRDAKAAFEALHALKGAVGNLSLTPLFAPINEMTELLRKRTDTDYSALLHEAQMQFEKLCSL